MERKRELHFVEEVVEGEGLDAQTLALASGCDNLSDLACGVEGIALHVLPMVEHALGEGLATRVGAEISSEACTTTESEMIPQIQIEMTRTE